MEKCTRDGRPQVALYGTFNSGVPDCTTEANKAAAIKVMRVHYQEYLDAQSNLVKEIQFRS